MAVSVRLSIPPHNPIQGREKAGLGLEQAILTTTGVIRREFLLQLSPQNQNKSEKLQAPC